MKDAHNAEDVAPPEARCEMCGEAMWWIECPTGGWWKHVQHPADHHDGEAPVPTHIDGNVSAE